MRHFGEHDGYPCVILGYNPTQGNILLVHLDDISEGREEEEFLRFIQRHADELNPLARAITLNPEKYMDYPSITLYYSSKRSVTDGTCLRQIPEFHVIMYDEQQSQQWTGSSARYKSEQRQHRITDRFKASMGHPVAPVIAPPPTRPELATTGQLETTQEVRLESQSVNSLEGDAAIRYLKENGIPIPEGINRNVTDVVTPDIGHVSDEVNTNPTEMEKSPMSNDSDVLSVLNKIAGSLDNMDGNFNRVFKRMDEVDKSIRSAARNMEKVGFDKPVTPPTPKQRAKENEETS